MDSSTAPRSWPGTVGTKLRHATFILPRTGQRLKAALSYYTTRRNRPTDDRTPLLSHFPREYDQSGEQSQLKAAWTAGDAWVRSETGLGILKFSLAYLLGTCATLIPALSSMLGNGGSKHTVATITVYFHPARTKGSMLKALVCAFLAFVYAAFVCLTSMAVSVLFEDYLHLLPMGHVIVLLVFCGGGLGFVGWIKQRLGDPLVNVACSLTSLSIITVLTKEGAVQKGDLSFGKIFHVLKMLVMGVTITGAVCLLVFPLSAKAKLRQDIQRATRSISCMLEAITEGFLHGSPEVLDNQASEGYLNQNKKASAGMRKFLPEAKLEHYVTGTVDEYLMEESLVRCVEDLTQSIGSLRSAASLQSTLLRETYSRPDVATPTHFLRSPKQVPNGQSLSPCSSGPATLQESPLLHQATRADPTARSPTPEAISSEPHTSPTGSHPLTSTVFQSPADIFENFIYHLEPSMRSLAFTLKEMLEELPFGPAPDFKVVINSKFRLSLDRALELYGASRDKALKSIYSWKSSIGVQSTEVKADLEEVAASCAHFSFSLLEFALQLKGFLELLDQLHLESEERPRGRSWRWLIFWSSNKKADHETRSASHNRRNLLRQMSFSPDVPADQTTANLRDHTAQPKEPFRYRLWKSLSTFRRNETKFSFKVGAGAALYAMPAFLTSTRPTYSLWHGEWGLLSYMIVCSMTIGASNTTGYARFLGTLLGAFCAVAAWYISRVQAIGLAIIGWAMSLWVGHLILAKGQGPMGRFILLTYNLVVLYAYLLVQSDIGNDPEEGGEAPVIADIALHRVVAVLSGVIWGIIITRVVWPISARRGLKDGLSLLWLRMSVVWKRDPLSTISEGKSTSYLTPTERLCFQQHLSNLESLLTAARSEFSLKQIFPSATYQSILVRTRRMLDAYQAINLETMKNLPPSEGKKEMLKYTFTERRELSLRLSHLLSVLAASIKLGYSFGDSRSLPNIEHARDRVLTRLYHYRENVNISYLTSAEDYALLYAYVLVTGQLGNEISGLIQEISGLYDKTNDIVLLS